MDFYHRGKEAAPRRRRADPSSTPVSASSGPITSSTSSDVPSSTTPASVAPGNGPTTVFSIEDPPHFTATSSQPYVAIGVNATHPITATTSGATTSTKTSSTSSTSTYTDPAAAAIASAQAFGIPPNELTACEVNGTEADNGPFCSPIQHQNLWVGFTYALTWNPALFPENATAYVQLRYEDTSLGNVTWASDPVPNYKGVVDVQMSNDWLQGASGNNSDLGRNLTLWMVSAPLGGQNITKPGPQLSLVVDPKTLPRILLKPIASKYGLEIGLPIGIVALLVIFLSICCAIRRQNREHRSIRGVTQDYMKKRARRRGKGGDIAMDDYNSESGYTDQPVKGGHNVFRSEIARQREEDDESLRRFPSSF